ncbi:uncharacterized protein YjbK [Evansella vedderi]|uniref:Uncharacterized protein YjbK n=1 Tax=Evansella vedderi TaxID=38282 RepID=A0ABT9ZXC6_9BACI|nr:CYTH domain-containing protein [Evansella vedderi]MDQ0255387.1 uncharacterized protein YjbK [Evansella vedderi]
MTQEIEIEFKNLLTRNEYISLMNAFGITDKEKVGQTNYYFDTKEMQLKENKCALRIRKKGDHYILTLKEPLKEGLLETHQTLSSHEVDRAISEGILPDTGDVVSQLKDILKTTNLIQMTYLGELTTERLEKTLPEGLLVLDKSYYFDIVDYELEFECEEWSTGQAFFESMLSKHNIPKRKTPNKILRFYNEKIRRSS